VSPAGPVADPPRQEDSMLVSLSLQPVVALIAGILILVMPRLLNYIVAIYLIVIGLLGLMHR
jgi:threonine/homoserine efflux transporter RhtA